LDQWNGKIAKEDVKLKNSACGELFAGLFGAPVNVFHGYIKKLTIEVPWSNLLSKPVEVKIEDVHIILTQSAKYDREFVKRTLLRTKRAKVEKLLKQIKVSGD